MTGAVVTKYYYAGAQRVAMRKNGTLNFLLGDHLGSTSLTTNDSGNVISEMRYTPWGEVRYNAGTTPTDYGFTGQMSYAGEFGLLYYNARWVDPYLNHFTQPDSIVPDPYNSQDYDRYAYARNNPVNNTDPTGHESITDESLGLTLNGWSEENAEAMFSELRLLAGKLKHAYDNYRCHNTICSDEPTLSASEIFKKVFGSQTWTYESSMGGCDAAQNKCGTDTADYATDFENKGLIIHEFSHHFDHGIIPEKWGYARNILYNTTIWDENGNYVEGKINGTGAWQRTTDGYDRDGGRPYTQHPLNWADGNTQGEDFADMLMNYTQNSFANNPAGDARYAWMDSHMGMWVYFSITP